MEVTVELRRIAISVKEEISHAIYPLEYNIFEDTRSPGEVKRNSTKTGCIEMLW